jgi:hypothetical protein
MKSAHSVASTRGPRWSVLVILPCLSLSTSDCAVQGRATCHTHQPGWSVEAARAWDFKAYSLALYLSHPFHLLLLCLCPQVHHDGTTYDLRVAELQPDRAVSVMDTDMAVEVGPSIETEGYLRAREQALAQEQERLRQLEEQRQQVAAEVRTCWGWMRVCVGRRCCMLSGTGSCCLSTLHQHERCVALHLRCAAVLWCRRLQQPRLPAELQRRRQQRRLPADCVYKQTRQPQCPRRWKPAAASRMWWCWCGCQMGSGSCGAAGWTSHCRCCMTSLTAR